MLLWATFDQDSVIARVKILDATSSVGAGLAGLTSGSSGLNISTIADVEATPTAYTGSNIEGVSVLGTYAAPTSGKCRFEEVDPTNHPGVYELQFANARFAVAGAKSLLVSINGAADMVECDALIPLPKVDLFASTGRVAANVKEVDDSDDAAERLKHGALALGFGTIDAGASTTTLPIKTLSLTVGVASQLKNRVLVFKPETGTANLAGFPTRITDVLLSPLRFTVSPACPATPAEDDEFSLE